MAEAEIEAQETKPRWRWGVNRWIIFALWIGLIYTTSIYPPITPVIQLPAEHLSEEPIISTPLLGDVYFTNTMMAMIIADIIAVILAFFTWRAIRSGKLILTGIVGAVEAILEGLWDLTESTAGKWAKTIFPLMGAVFLFVLIANWIELIPGVDSVGIPHHAEQEGHPLESLGTIGELPVVTIVQGEEISGPPAAQDAEHDEDLYVITGFVRTLSTDLNFTLALALIVVLAVQVIGFRALGFSYLEKFFAVRGMFATPFFGLINFGAGLLELLSEFVRIIAFTFRLFGNIFAGTVLLFVMGTLLPIIQSGFLLLEFFVGLIQAAIFALLTLIFMAQATQGHGHDDDH